MEKTTSSLHEVNNASLTKTSFWRQPLSTGIVIAAVALMTLNLVDAFSTLYLVSFGGEEMNPFMKIFLAQGPFSFFTIKYVLAFFGVMVIVSFCRQQPLARRLLVYVLLPAYFIVATYNTVLLSVVK